MPMPTWSLVSVTVERPGTHESRGATVADWSNATKSTLSGCWVGSPATTADTSAQDRDETVTATLFAPAGSDVMRGDRVTFAGTRYRVDGVLSFPSPFGGTDHIEASLISWE